MQVFLEKSTIWLEKSTFWHFMDKNSNFDQKRMIFCIIMPFPNPASMKLPDIKEKNSDKWFEDAIFFCKNSGISWFWTHFFFSKIWIFRPCVSSPKTMWNSVFGQKARSPPPKKTPENAQKLEKRSDQTLKKHFCGKKSKNSDDCNCATESLTLVAKSHKMNDFDAMVDPIHLQTQQLGWDGWRKGLSVCGDGTMGGRVNGFSVISITLPFHSRSCYEANDAWLFLPFTDIRRDLETKIFCL